MGQIITSARRDFEIKIDDQIYIARQLSMGDFMAIGDWIYQQRKDAIRIEYEEKIKENPNAAKLLLAEKNERLLEIIPPSTGEIVNFLAYEPRGNAIALTTALKKNHPEITFDFCSNIGFSNELREIVWDIVGVSASKKN
jgi:hypothetical protein